MSWKYSCGSIDGGANPSLIKRIHVIVSGVRKLVDVISTGRLKRKLIDWIRIGKENVRRLIIMSRE
jgi:hypothetical protein